MKKILLIFTLLLTLAAPMHAQVFMMEDDNDPNRTVLGNGTYGNIIAHGSGYDQANFVPLGEGIALLTALGGAYLLRKKNKTK